MLAIRLSLRNVLTLLHKLEKEGSHRTLIKTIDSGQRVALIIEPDEVHYAGRPEPPGPMSPDTEQFVMDMSEALEIVRSRN